MTPRAKGAGRCGAVAGVEPWQVWSRGGGGPTHHWPRHAKGAVVCHTCWPGMCYKFYENSL